MERDANEFVCADCGWSVVSLPPRTPAPTRCKMCEWLNKYIPDPAAREAMRDRVDPE